MPAPRRSPRRTQEERSSQTQGAILDATVAAIVELGYARTTTLEVQRRAEVSRGALLHHFPSKAELMAEVIHHLALLRGRELKELAAKLPAAGDDRVSVALALLWESFTGPLALVALELRTAARTEPELARILASAERTLRDNIGRQWRHLFGEEIANGPGFEVALDLSLHVMIGVAMSTSLHPDPQRVQSLLDAWRNTFLYLVHTGGNAEKESEPWVAS